MAVTTPAVDYPDIFRTYIVQGAQQTLAQVRQCEDLGRQPAMRDTILHMLDFILTHPATVAQGLEILERLAPQMEQAGYWESWMPYLQQGLHQSQMFGDTHAEARPLVGHPLSTAEPTRPGISSFAAKRDRLCKRGRYGASGQSIESVGLCRASATVLHRQSARG